MDISVLQWIYRLYNGYIPFVMDKRKFTLNLVSGTVNMDESTPKSKESYPKPL
ncbi:hypothetical protein [Sutcliffiella horikoshii]|uniref:hypothetical protein n=1 Tax=Sutcliffiella horikoshii TaxID=79883 RepID=UPI001653713F|nr:hypothetical protein [Sutcliffiella horikoshii]